MLDYFALLNEPRRPWSDPEQLRQKFLSLSTEAHPDRKHQEHKVELQAAELEFTELNAAYQRLRNPKDRLHHLLELELGSGPRQVQQIPAEMIDLFGLVGAVCRETDAFLAEKAATTSPLLQVGIFERSQDWSEKLTSVRQQIDSRSKSAMARLEKIDAEWIAQGSTDPRTRPRLLAEMETLCHLFGYLGKWSSQVQERLVQLSF